MAKLQHKTISKRTVEALKVEKDTVFWDSELIGFGVRAYPSGSKHYVVQTRARGTAKRLTVGRHGIITAEEARRRAALMIARIKAGEEPVPEPMAKLAGGADGRRACSALSGRACDGALQAGDGGNLRPGDRQVHRAGLRQGAHPGAGP